MAELQPVLVAGRWRPASATSSFQAENPATLTLLDDRYPISTWTDCDDALQAASEAFAVLEQTPPGRIAQFLEQFASRIDRRAEQLVELAHQETALPIAPRLRDVELPRTTNQLRQAARAAVEQSWRLPTIDRALNIRSMYRAIGPVAVFGPNNFPFAFNSVAGGDFAAAIAAGNPVIAKANTSHPGTTRLLAEEAHIAAQAAELPAATIQLLYRLDHQDGQRLVSDPRLGASGYTGSRSAGLQLKAAADAAGKPIYLELSSINPVVILPGAIKERASQIADEFCTSCLMGAGQFCTNPGLLILIRSDAADQFIAAVRERFQQAGVGTLLSQRVADALAQSVAHLQASGAQVLAGGSAGGGRGASFRNTLLQVAGATFLARSADLQVEAFGNASLVVVADHLDQAAEIVDRTEGNLTGTIYSSRAGEDDAAYARIEPLLRRRIGRLLNDKMPTGVAVSAAMNHGGPYPATGHPGFTAVGIPASLRRFAKLDCYDNVRPERLPSALRDKNPGQTWRLVDGQWSQADIT